MDLAGINHPAFILFKAVHDDDLPRVQATLTDEPDLWARARLTEWTLLNLRRRR